MKKQESFPKFSKSARTKLHLIKSAITCFSRLGFEKSTITLIAKEAQLSRPLVAKHFKSKEEIFFLSIEFIAKNANDFMNSHHNSNNLTLESYLNMTFDWVSSFEEHFLVWIQFLQKSCLNNQYKNLNHKVKEKARQRLYKILEAQEVKSSHLKKFAHYFHELIYAKVISYYTGGEGEKSLKEISKELNLFFKISLIDL